jgi:protein-disulfide isomerase
MASRRILCAGLLMAVLLVSACDSSAPGLTATATIPQAVTTPTATLAEATPELPGEVEMGFTEDGAPYRGNPDAPVTLLEFSEYL